LDKDLSNESPKKTNLKSPLLSDGIWGGNTDESYKSILAEHNKGKPDPKNMDEALLFLNQVKLSLSDAKTRADGKEVAKDQAPATSQPKPAPAINDDQAKAAFRGLLESIQSGRIKLKAGSNTNEFRQRIGRDWGAIIRAYNGPQGVVDAFYEGLALTEDEKTQLININREGLDGTSAVVGKINQKFLEAINAYIKPFGRTLRTERSMARVIKRRRERKQNRANAALKDLWILSKVAQRKEVAREHLVKTAQGQYEYNNYYVFGQQIMNAGSTINRLDDDDKSKTMKSLFDSIKTSDIKAKYNFLFGVQNEKFENLDKKDILGILENAIENLKNLSADQPNNWGRNFYKKSNEVLYEIIAAMESFVDYIKVRYTSDGKETAAKTTPPNTTTRRLTTDLTTLRQLLTTAGHTPGTGTGWASLDSAFRAAVEDFANLKKIRLNSPWNWGSVSKSMFGMAPDISGAEALVGKLIDLKRDTDSQASAPGTPTAAAPAPVEESIGNNKVVEGLRFLFDKILSGEVKVDKAGPDFRRDSKNFRGIIRGLGGTNGAALYCAEKCGFTSEENTEIIDYPALDITTLGGKVDRSSVLRKIYNQFMLLMREARRGVGRDNRGITEEQLNRSVSRVMRERASETKKAASISKSIEIRKAAARKKLGLQS
jgi:hypothetical protein